MAKTPPVRMLPVTNMTPKEGMPAPCIPPYVADDILIMFIMCIYFVVSFVYIISGYRCYRFCLFITAFTMASVATYSICEQEKLMSQNLNITVAVIIGILFGMLNTAVQAVGMIVTGLHSGFIGSIVCLTLFNYYVDKGHKTCWLHVLVVVMSSITTGMLSIFRRKVMTIISTSIYGASLLTVCISMYYHKLTSLNWVMQRLKLKHDVEEPCPLSLGLITIWCIVSIVGIIVQCTLTGRGIHHEQRIVIQKRRAATQPLRLTREQRAEARQRKYRYLYQVRTAHGDVISQNYVQALQKTAASDHWNSGPGESSTLQSDSTHLTVLASDHMPLPESEEDVVRSVRVCH